jgi:hypothetical protein
MLIKLVNLQNDMILINTDHIIKVIPYKDGIVIRFTDGESEELIPYITIEEFLVKTRETSSDLGKMTDALCSRIQHLEDAMAAGLQYIGKSCH